MTRCPSDGFVVHTGRHMTATGFADLIGRFAFRCSRCERIHEWRKEDAWVEGQPGRNLMGADA